MRIIHYGVINKKTNKVIYTNCKQDKEDKFLATLADKENYVIGYKWVSI